MDGTDDFSAGGGKSVQTSPSVLQLKPTEFLNLDVILEGVMNRLVLKELREHIYSLLVDEYVSNGSIPSMVENIHYAKSKSIQDFAVRVSVRS